MLASQLPGSDPALFLGWDDAFLDAADQGGPETIWFWESPAPFVVVGYGQQVEREVDTEACRRRGMPVLRRCSGGGTVVQGPGCLSYGLALRIDPAGPTATITGTNHWVMDRQRRAMATLLGDGVQVRGHTDLALATASGERKFSGNAQRRKRDALLFHGTILLHFDLPLIADVLRPPSLEPDYRGKRGHLDFVVETGLAKSAVIAALCSEWRAAGQHPSPPTAAAEAAAGRYRQPEWNLRR